MTVTTTSFLLHLVGHIFIHLIVYRPDSRISATLEQTHLLPSRLLAPHARFYVREMRILAYAQLLQSYSSLTLDSLAHAFGVTVDFVDKYAVYWTASF